MARNPFLFFPLFASKESHGMHEKCKLLCSFWKAAVKMMAPVPLSGIALAPVLCAVCIVSCNCTVFKPLDRISDEGSEAKSNSALRRQLIYCAVLLARDLFSVSLIE